MARRQRARGAGIRNGGSDLCLRWPPPWFKGGSPFSVLVRRSPSFSLSPGFEMVPDQPNPIKAIGDHQGQGTLPIEPGIAVGPVNPAIRAGRKDRVKVAVDSKDQADPLDLFDSEDRIRPEEPTALIRIQLPCVCHVVEDAESWRREALDISLGQLGERFGRPGEPFFWVLVSRILWLRLSLRLRFHKSFSARSFHSFAVPGSQAFKQACFHSGSLLLPPGTCLQMAGQKVLFDLFKVGGNPGAFLGTGPVRLHAVP
ncbi:hypothetical protein METESE_31750 [Mesoterricola sediminis]|uniref:Uncharacterized protein n=1 Tax=Mesoterricola sediminis TaxID=2927980 RepID=A0AA48KFD8_9BACT|nr:hypothetical protein METESE_31750 [Mesoterricola sediminis]